MGGQEKEKRKTDSSPPSLRLSSRQMRKLRARLVRSKSNARVSHRPRWRSMFAKQERAYITKKKKQQASTATRPHRSSRHLERVVKAPCIPRRRSLFSLLFPCVSLPLSLRATIFEFVRTLARSRARRATSRDRDRAATCLPWNGLG